MRDAFSNNEDAPTKPNLGEVLFEILWLYFYEVVIAPVNEVCSADIVAMMSQTPHWFGLVLGPRQASSLSATLAQSPPAQGCPKQPGKTRQATSRPCQPIAGLSQN